MVCSKRKLLMKRKVREERSRAKLYNCNSCGKHLGVNDIHHLQCNKCWRESHPWETMINRKKSGKW